MIALANAALFAKPILDLNSSVSETYGRQERRTLRAQVAAPPSMCSLACVLHIDKVILLVHI